MTEEPYRWMEAIANRREYLEHQLAGGSPLVALSFRSGILLFTLGRERQKIFEVYDRIGMGGIGHPGDLERLRMAAIELASTEGFTRSAQDVSLRRLATYSLSPALKAAFEQIYGPPYLARLLFAELGRREAPPLFLRMDYDGTMHTNGGVFGQVFEWFGVLSGTAASMQKMEAHLRAHQPEDLPLEKILPVALETWAVGRLALEDVDKSLNEEELRAYAQEQLASSAIEAALLDGASRSPVTWRSLPDAEVRPLLNKR